MAIGDADRRRMVARHQQRAHGGTLSPPALRRAVQRAFDSYARYWVEAFRLPQLSAADLDNGMSYEGFEHLTTALAGGKGAILVIPHLGCWDWAGAWVATQGIPITVIVEPIEPPELFEWFAEFRRSLGMTVVPLGPDVASASLRALKNNEILCLLSDRDITGTGIQVEFFGETTTLSPGAATLAFRTGAPIIPVAAYYREHMHHGVVRPRIPVERSGGLRDDVARVTQQVADELESLIRRAPEQWHLMQANWPSDRE
ncbi:MAG: phosphatidylinositol dimannoside acyltransferase [Actinomycetota bacterium]